VTSTVGNQALLEVLVEVEVVAMMLATASVFVLLPDRELDVVTTVCCPDGSDEVFEVTGGRFPVVVDGSCPAEVGDVTITLFGGVDVVCVVVLSPCPRVVVDGGG
jgi:hypothetical protein